MPFFKIPHLLVLALLLQSLAAGVANGAVEYQRTALADGFDFPVGAPDAKGYRRARGFRPYGHAGDDWNGYGGGDSDLGDPVYAVAHGVVVYSKDYGSSWGNLVIIRHAYRRTKDNKVYYIDSLYGHLHERLVSLYTKVRRGQKIGTIGNNRGLYSAHLHFEIRKNLNIGPYQTKYAIDYNNYFAPSEFIKENRSLRLEYHLQRVPVDTFGTGISNLFHGKSIGSIPPVPKPNSESRETLNADLREILTRHNLGRLSRGKPVRSPGATPIDTPEAEREREEILAFWKEFRNKIPEPSAREQSGKVELE